MAVCCFCKFGKVEDDSTITCRRYPSFISKAPDDWCGEFEAAQHSAHPTSEADDQTSEDWSSDNSHLNEAVSRFTRG